MDEESNRISVCLNEVAKRVELMRDQALALQKEKESLLELLQHLQDDGTNKQMPQDVQEDVDWQTERLIVRCLTVEVAVLTPRNESQESAFKAISEIINKLDSVVVDDPHTHRLTVISYLNASLPEPLDGNVDMRFQGKLLSCTVDDQKYFRKRLQDMMDKVNEALKTSCNGGVRPQIDAPQCDEEAIKKDNATTLS